VKNVESQFRIAAGVHIVMIVIATLSNLRVKGRSEIIIIHVKIAGAKTAPVAVMEMGINFFLSGDLNETKIKNR
jgi:hypothetical protein